MIDYRPMIISSLVLNVIVMYDLVAYSGSDNFFKFVTIMIDILVIMIAVFDIFHGLSKRRYK